MVFHHQRTIIATNRHHWRRHGPSHGRWTLRFVCNKSIVFPLLHESGVRYINNNTTSIYCWPKSLYLHSITDAAIANNNGISSLVYGAHARTLCPFICSKITIEIYSPSSFIFYLFASGAERKRCYLLFGNDEVKVNRKWIYIDGNEWQKKPPQQIHNHNHNRLQRGRPPPPPPPPSGSCHKWPKRFSSAHTCVRSWTKTTVFRTDTVQSIRMWLIQSKCAS